MRTLLVFLTLACATVSFAQKLNDKNVPAAVKSSLQKNLGITSATWEKEGENYEADYTVKGAENSAVLSSTGVVLETEIEIAQNELPPAAQSQIAKAYAGFKVVEAAKITAAGVITFEAELKKEKQAFELIFDEQGEILKNSTKNEKR